MVDESAFEKYGYKKCVRDIDEIEVRTAFQKDPFTNEPPVETIWKIVLDETMRMFSPNFGSVPSKRFGMTKGGLTNSDDARKISQTVYEAVHTRWRECASRTNSPVPGSKWSMCSESMTLADNAKWQDWLYRTKMSPDFRKRVVLPS